MKIQINNLRFITLIDIFYEKKIRLTLSFEENFEEFKFVK